MRPPSRRRLRWKRRSCLARKMQRNTVFDIFLTFSCLLQNVLFFSVFEIHSTQYFVDSCSSFFPTQICTIFGSTSKSHRTLVIMSDTLFAAATIIVKSLYDQHGNSDY